MDLRMTGARLMKVRPMTDDERALEGWEAVKGDIIVGEYDNGAIMYPACSNCDHPGDAWAMYGGDRWKLDPRGELTECPKPVTVTLPRWAIVAIWTGLVLTVVGVLGVLALAIEGAV